MAEKRKRDASSTNDLLNKLLRIGIVTEKDVAEWDQNVNNTVEQVQEESLTADQIEQFARQNDEEIFANYSGIFDQSGNVLPEHASKRCRIEEENSTAGIEMYQSEENPADTYPYAHLPITEVPGLNPTMLAEKNRYADFDDHVHFDEPTHVYTVDGVRYRGSCTGFLGQWFEKFDSDATADKIVGSWKWKFAKDYRYYQMTKDQIKHEWTMANKLGTRMHFCAELLMNGIEVPEHPDFQTVEFAHHFRNFWRDHVEGKLRPWRSEWIVFHRVYEIIGSVDGIMQRVDSQDPYELVLYDWKRCIKIEHEAYQNQTAKGPFAGLPKANFWKYALQLNTYKFIIEQGTPYHVSEMFLLRCHPDSANYERIKVPDMQHYVRKAVAVRFDRLMEADLTTLARRLKKLTAVTTTATSTTEQEECVPDSTDDKNSLLEQATDKGLSDEDSIDDIPESPLDPASLALQILTRYKAHKRAVQNVCSVSDAVLSVVDTVMANSDNYQSTFSSENMVDVSKASSLQDTRYAYKFDDD